MFLLWTKCDSIAHECGQIGVPALVISFNCPKETAKQRFLSRKLPDRLHDDDAMFEKRFAEFEREEGEIVQYYRSQGQLEEVNGPSFCHPYSIYTGVG